MPHLLVPGIRYPVSLLECFKTLAFGHNTSSCWQKESIWLQISNLEISHANTPSAENYLKEVLHVNSEKVRTIRITHVKADLRLFGVLAEHHFQDLIFPLLSTVDLLGNSVHAVQVIGIVTKCRELVNLIFEAM